MLLQLAVKTGKSGHRSPVHDGRIILPQSLRNRIFMCQSAAVLAGSGLSLRPCVVGKCLHGLLAGALASVLLGLAPHAAPTFAPGALPAPAGSALPGILLLSFSILLPFVSGKRRRDLV